MEKLEQWRRAGRIAALALEHGRKLIKNGAIIRDVCDEIDYKIIELGAEPAWPSQMGLNEVAAHATPDHDDETVFDNHVVCLDVGAQVEGCIGDNAVTVDLSGKYEHILKAAQDALNNAIKIVKKGVTLGEIGQTIQDSITAHGAVPVKNLSGHGITEWTIHDQPSVPNHATGDKRTLKGDQIIAIEPFATNGAGMIYESEQANIFAMENPKPVRSQWTRDIMEFIEENYGCLPFASRWIIKEFGVGKTNMALREMLRQQILTDHAPLIEKGKGMVAVFEKTMYVTDDGCEVLTKI